MTEFVEADVAEKGAGHGKYEGRIEEDETGLADMGIVCDYLEQLLFLIRKWWCNIPNRTSPVATKHAGRLYPLSHIVKNTTGTVRDPISAGIARKATYGTLLSMYESPMLSNLK